MKEIRKAFFAGCGNKIVISPHRFTCLAIFGTLANGTLKIYSKVFIQNKRHSSPTNLF
jgi:hypothetical protein